MVYVPVLPTHPFAVGVTVIVPTTAVLPLFKAVKDAILPIPEEAKPIDGSEFVHVKVVPDTVPVKFTGLIAALLQTTWLATVVIVGVGFTVMVNVPILPTQAFADGVTVIVPSTVVVPLFTAVKDAILPVPFDGIPIDGRELDQVKVVPDTAPVKFTSIVDPLLHTI